jgi:hypothetical protein
MAKFRPFLLDFVRILFLYLGIRVALEYISGSGFDPLNLVKSQILEAAMFAGLFSAIRLIIKPKAKN